MTLSYKILIILFFTTLTSISQNLDDKYISKVSTSDSIILNLYDVISGDKTEKRNWELFKYLFKKDARLISTRNTSNGQKDVFFMTIDQYAENAKTFFKINNFFEKEIYRKTETFGPITHVLSTYETFNEIESIKPIARGINSIQLFNDGNRWWIINVYWSTETKENTIPNKYLPS